MTRILHLDSYPDILEILSSISQAAGCETLTTSDSYEAWAVLHSVPVDLLMEDLTLAPIDGLKLLELVRADNQLGGIPVLIVSAKVYAQAQTAAFKAGANGYVTKPFTTQQIISEIDRLMLARGKRHLSIPAVLKIFANRPGADTCVPALKDTDPSVRLDAVNGLKWLKDTRAVEPLLSLLNDSEIQVRWAAIHTLGLLNDRRAVQPLMALLRDADVLNRWAAALALGRLDAKEALKPLVAALGDENNLVRMMAALAVGYLKDPGLIISQLRGLLTDSDPMVVRAAGQALNDTKTQRDVKKPELTRPKRAKEQASLTEARNPILKIAMVTGWLYMFIAVNVLMSGEPVDAGGWIYPLHAVGAMLIAIVYPFIWLYHLIFG